MVVVFVVVASLPLVTVVRDCVLVGMVVIASGSVREESREHTHLTCEERSAKERQQSSVADGCSARMQCMNAISRVRRINGGVLVPA